MSVRTLAGGVAASVISLGCVSGPVGTLGEARYGVCRQQITDYVQEKLGQTPTRIEVQGYSETMPPTGMFDAGSALVYVEECSGFHAFEIRATESVCEYLPHYGKTGPYIRYEGAFEGCRKK